MIKNASEDQRGITTDKERRKLFLRYINRGWLIFGLVTLVALPFFPEQRSRLVYLLAVIFPSYLLIQLLNRFGRTRLAGVIFTIIVNFGFYGLFLVLVREMGAEEAFRTQATVLMLMGLAVLFGGALVDKWAAPAVALVNTILLIGTRLTIAPGSPPRPSALVFWWMMAVIVWLYEGTLQRAFGRVWNELAERNEAEDALRESERRYRLLAENVTDVIWTMDMNLRSTYTSPSVKRLRGYEAADARAQSLEETLTPASLEIAKKTLEEELAIEQISAKDPFRSRTLELEVLRKDGSTAWVETTMTFLRDPDGVPVEILGVNRDITERKRSEQAVRDSGARLAGIIDSAMDAIVSLDADQRIALFNPAAEQMFRCPATEVIGQPLDRFIPERFREAHKEHIRAFGQTNQTKRSMSILGPLACLRADGEEFPAEITVSQTEIAGQKIYTAILRDVTERVRAEKLQESIFEIARAAMTAQTLDELYAKIHAALQNLLPAQHFYIAMYDRESDLLSFPYFQDVFDVPSPPGKPGRGLTEYVLRTSKPFLATREITNELIRSGQVELIGADSIEWLGVPLVVRDQAIGVMTVQSYEETIHFSARDLEVMMYVSTQVASTIERKQAEQSLQQSEEKYRLLFENMMNGFAIHKIVLDKKGKVIDYIFLEVNSAFEQMTGLKRENIIGKRVTEALPGIEKDPADWIGKYGEVTLTGKENRFEQYAQPLGKWYSVLAFSPREGQFATIFEDVTERKQAEAAQHRRVDELTALYQTTLDIISSRDLPGLLNIIVARAVDLLDGTSGGLYLCDPEQKLARLVVSYKTPEDYTGTVLAYEEGAAGAVAATGEPLIIDDYRTWQGRAKAYEEKQPFSAVISVPMLWQGQVIGVIDVLHDTEQHKFTGEDLKLLTSFANQAAIAVENARLLEETQRHLEQLSTLRQIDQAISSSLDLRVTLNILLGHILHQLKVDAATVLLYQPELQSLEFIVGLGFRTRALQSTNLRLGQGFAGQAALEQRIVRVSDLSQMQTGFLRSPEFRNEGFVTYVGVPLIAKGKIIGVLEIYHRHSLDPDTEWMSFLETLAGQAAIAIDNIRLFEDLQSSNLQLLQAYDATIEGWAKALELRDMEVEGHSKRAVEMTLELARKMGIQESQLTYIRWGALLHDIGKMGVPDAILQKPGILTDAEWEIMRQHPAYAYKWLSPILYLKPALDIPYCHHEKWDGTGYPRGLKGEQIPLAARIFAVVDVWDALTSDRPYRLAWSQKKARDYILKNSRTHFDPQVVETFLTDFADLVKE